MYVYKYIVILLISFILKNVKKKKIELIMTLMSKLILYTSIYNFIKTVNFIFLFI